LSYVSEVEGTVDRVKSCFASFTYYWCSRSVNK